MPPVAVVGNLSRDHVDGGPPRLGGGPYHAARGLRVLGRPARIVARCGNGDRRAFLRRLTSLGVPVHAVRGGSTAAFSIRYEGDERIMSIDELGDTWTPRDVGRDALGDAVWVHVAPLARSDFPAETLARLAQGRRISLDGQGLVRVPRVGPLELDAEYDPEVLRYLAVLKLAEEEARVLLGETTPAALASLRVPEVLVTRGKVGSTLWAGGRLVDVPARPIEDVDPTGAGDAFAAGYLVGRSEGLAPAAAARRATALVASLLSVRAR